VRDRRRRHLDKNVEALLRDVSALRLTLDTDLTVAAAAAEADRLDLSAEIVELNRLELAAFADDAVARLGDTPPTCEPADVQPPAPHFSWRNRIALTAAPAVVGAAALIIAIAMTGGAPRSTPETAQPRLVASYSTLTELARTNRDPAALIAVGRELNLSLSQLIAAAPHDAATAQQAFRILVAEQQLLKAHHPNGAAALLAQAAALVHELQQTVPMSVLVRTRPPTKRVVLPPVLPLPTAHASSPPADSGHSSAPTQSPSAETSPPPPAPEPTSGDATVAPEPSPQPTSRDPWPFDSDFDNGG
jgi:hypothetical protein